MPSLSEEKKHWPDSTFPERETSAAAERAAANLPVRVIEPKRGWGLIDWQELWSHRELLYFLAWRDLKVRYKETVLGAAWAVLKPLSMMAAFTILFSRRFTPEGFDQLGIPYPLYLYAGLIPWFFFSMAFGTAAGSVVGNSQLFTKVSFPRLLLPIAAVSESLADFLVSFVVLILLVLGFALAGQYTQGPGWNVLMVPVLALLLLVGGLGVGIFLSALVVVYKDVRQVIPFLSLFWMFMTPTIFMMPTPFTPKTPAAVAPEMASVVSPETPDAEPAPPPETSDAEPAVEIGFISREVDLLLPLNPAQGLVYNFRVALLGREPFDWYSLGVSAAVSVAMLVFGCLYFRRVERAFPDVI